MEMTRRPIGRNRSALHGRAEARGPGRRAGVVGALLGLLILTPFASSLSRAEEAATPYEIVWAHPDESAVQRFVVFASSVRGDASRARRIDVGKPAGNESGVVHVFSAIVAIRSNEFVALAAVGYDGRMGELSGWSGLPPTRPGQPIVIAP